MSKVEVLKAEEEQSDAPAHFEKAGEDQEPVDELLLKSEEEFKSHRVFINNVDTYHCRHIASYITDQIYGAFKLTRAGGPDEGAGDDEEEEDTEPGSAPAQPLGVILPKNQYEVIGTLSKDYEKESEDVLQVVKFDQQDEYKEEILKCGFIVFDITREPEEMDKALYTLDVIEEELDRIRNIGPKTFQRYDQIRVFVLISNVMTWAKTKPLDRNDPDLPFSEIDYKKRKPHPNYRRQKDVEKEVMKRGQKYPDKLKTYVLCSGITYGDEEEDLELFFKIAWYNETIPIFDEGTNVIPLIHVKDLARALHGLMEVAPPKPQYVLAVEQTPSTQKQVFKALSKTMGTGRTVNVAMSEALLMKDMNQMIFDRCMVNLNMEPVFLVENLQIQFKSDLNLPENMREIVREFRAARNLKPVKIVVHGPPGSGKTTLARRLCEFYGAQYVSADTVVDELLTEMREDVARLKKLGAEKSLKEEGISKKDTVEDEELGEEEEEDEEEEEEDQDPAAIMEQIREIEGLLESGNGKVPDDYMIGLMRRFIGRNFCQNRGYVLDEYPFTLQQAKEIFGPGEAGEGGGDIVVTSDIIPELVVSLQATDDFICSRVMQLPEDLTYSEENMLQRLETFRRENTEDSTMLNFFDETEVDMLLVDSMDDVVQSIEEAFKLIQKKLGPPASFGLSDEEKEELYRIEEEQKRLEAEKQELNEKMFLETEEENRRKKMEDWVETLERLQMEEEKILIAQSEPLRHYLMQFVFPTLTRGLIELAKCKPIDPVDFLAEYLFKENPEGKMFRPHFNVSGENLEESFRQEIDSIIDSVAFTPQ